MAAVNPQRVRHWAKEPKRLAVWLTAMSLLLLSLLTVFFGFVGYYSRVSLSSDLQHDSQNKDAQSLDYLFLRIDQIGKDENLLVALRAKRLSNSENYNDQYNKLNTEAYAAKEYQNFLDEKSKLIDATYKYRSLFEDDYWKDLIKVLFRDNPGFFWDSLDLVVSPRFKIASTDAAATTELASKSYVEFLQSTMRALLTYQATYGERFEQIRRNRDVALAPTTAELREIFDRNPQLLTSDELGILGITQESLEEKKLTQQKFAQQRAILRGYDNVVIGPARVVLQWPTIASTLLVTLVTGLLGGLINFMGVVGGQRSTPGDDDEYLREYDMIGLLRRSCLGITAALGIFLFFGSGLLVLTAQSSKSVNPSTLELSPYFVAFLAFISGFLADDAFARMTQAGRSLFSTSENGGGGAPGNGQSGDRPATEAGDNRAAGAASQHSSKGNA